jgi:uncharacterized protein (DUF983 family)
VRALRLLVRGARLRCPHCGVGRVMRSWLAIGPRCPECGLSFERDEENEYWLGAYLLNFIVTEVLFAVLLLAVLVATWPAPPWRALLVAGAVQMVVTPIVFYPFARALWLAIDLVVRPVKPEDLGPPAPPVSS